MRGLLLLYLAFWVFLGPSTEDVEHISATLLCINNLKQIALEARHGQGNDKGNCYIHLILMVIMV